MVEVVKGAVGLARLETGTVQYRAANKFVFDGARSQTATLRLNLDYTQKESHADQKWASPDADSQTRNYGQHCTTLTSSSLSG